MRSNSSTSLTESQDNDTSEASFQEESAPGDASSNYYEEESPKSEPQSPKREKAAATEAELGKSCPSGAGQGTSTTLTTAPVGIEDELGNVMSAIALVPDNKLEKLVGHNLTKPIRSQTRARVDEYSVRGYRFWLHVVSTFLRMGSGLGAILIAVLVFTGKKGHNITEKRQEDLQYYMTTAHLLATVFFSLPLIGTSAISCLFLHSITSKYRDAFVDRYRYETIGVRICMFVNIAFGVFCGYAGSLLDGTYCRGLNNEHSDLCFKGSQIYHGIIPAAASTIGSGLVFFSNTGRTFLAYNTLALIRIISSWTLIISSIFMKMETTNILALDSSQPFNSQVNLLGRIVETYGTTAGVIGLVGAGFGLIAGWTRSQVHIAFMILADIVTMFTAIAFGSGFLWALRIESFINEIPSLYETTVEGLELFQTSHLKLWMNIAIVAFAVYAAATLGAGLMGGLALFVARCTPREWTLQIRVLLRAAEKSAQNARALRQRPPTLRGKVSRGLSTCYGEKTGTIEVEIPNLEPHSPAAPQGFLPPIPQTPSCEQSSSVRSSAAEEESVSLSLESREQLSRDVPRVSFEVDA